MARDEAAAVLPFKLRPSREFAVAQAVIMALADCWPCSMTAMGPSFTAQIASQDIERGSGQSVHFLWLVRNNFRSIAARYDLQDTPCR